VNNLPDRTSEIDSRRKVLISCLFVENAGKNRRRRLLDSTAAGNEIATGVSALLQKITIRLLIVDF